MKSERNRLNTYENWDSNASQSPHNLAKAGFYYTGIEDRVECPFCFGVLETWQPTDVPMSKHRTNFPYCTFVKGGDVGNIPIEEVKKTSIPARSASHNENVEAMGSLNLLDLTKEENRLLSFSKWPMHLAQTSEVMARAGFYHIPSDEKPDRVKCAYCKGKLYNWEFGGDPWLQHARRFPTCPYVKLCVEEDVIRDWQNKECVQGVEVERLHSAGDSFGAHWKSSAVQANLEMGFSEANIKQIVERCLRERPINFPSAEELAAMAFDVEYAQAAAAASGDGQFEEPKSEDAFAKYWKSPSVQANLDMGFSEDSVKQIVQRCLQQRKESFPSAVELAAMIIDVEDSVAAASV